MGTGDAEVEVLKLSVWRQKNIIRSIGGRICLINSVLSSLPLSHLSFFKMPKKGDMLAKELLMG